MASPNTAKESCDDQELFNPLLSMGAQVSCILVISHFFQLLLKPFGQPGPVSQILAGFVIGRSGLSMFAPVGKFFFQNFATDYYETLALYARIAIMFLIGLEMDVPFLLRNLRAASIIACSGTLMCSIFAAAISSFMFQETRAQGSITEMALILIVILANTASPVVVRLAADLKFATSEIGRMAISAALIADIFAVFFLFVVSRNKSRTPTGTWVMYWFLYFLIVLGVIIVNMYLANWLNRRNVNNKYLKQTEFFFLLGVVFATALALESLGFSSIIACFLIGSMFPRGGKSARTLLNKLTYTVHNFVLPIYFGYSGFKADVTKVDNLQKLVIVAVLMVLSMGAKISGTLAACHYLKIPLNEGVLLAFLMNLKGHVDLLTLVAGLQNKDVVSTVFYDLMSVAIVINSVIMGPLIAFMVRREDEILGYTHIAFESQNPEAELRMLGCVHSPRPVATILAIMAASRGSANVPITPYLMHLIELPDRKKTRFREEEEENEFSDEEDYGAGNEVLEINEAVDIFTAETGVIINQAKIVSPFPSMYEDVCDFAEDVRASIIIVPFHKHQRIDLKMENGKDGIRKTNQKILRRAQCSVAILIDRGLKSGASKNSETESLRHVAILFFGGPDDREALGFSKRLSTHRHINITIIRFLPTSDRGRKLGFDVVKNKEQEILMAISDSDGTKNDADNASLTDFYHRYVTSGQVGYVEKYVENGEETACALKDMAEMYALFIVGKGGRGHSPLTVGMNDWEECPELGTVGDFLASPDFDVSGSVLVVQQKRPSRKDDGFVS